jgi:hypothetical protein
VIIWVTCCQPYGTNRIPYGSFVTVGNCGWTSAMHPARIAG